MLMAVLRIQPRIVMRLATLAVVVVILAHVVLVFGFHYYLGHASVAGLVTRFDLNLEANVPTFVSTSLLLCATSLLALIATTLRRRRDPHAVHWLVLTAVFASLALDEAAQLHDLLSPVTAQLLGSYGLPRFNWVIPATGFAAALAVAFIPFLSRLASRTRNLFILAGILYVGGAAGMEVGGGAWIERFGGEGHRGAAFHLILTVEETLEYAGVLVFIHALLGHLARDVLSLIHI